MAKERYLFYFFSQNLRIIPVEKIIKHERGIPFMQKIKLLHLRLCKGAIIYSTVLSIAQVK